MMEDPASATPGTAPLRGLPLSEQTLPALLERQAVERGDRTFIHAPGGVRTYRQVRDAAAGWAGMLRARGIRAGDRVAAICGNRFELIDLILGCAWMGAIAVPLNTALRGPQISHALTNSGARLLMIEASRGPVLAGIEPPPTLEEVWSLDGVPAPHLRHYRCSPAPEPGEPAEPAEVSPGDTMAIIYTSGTTGASKGVCCPHAQFYWWGIINSEVLSIGERDVLFTCLPLFHTNALNSLFQAMVAGATYAVEPRFSASRFWAQARAHDASVIYLLGAMVNILLAQPSVPGERAHRVRIALSPATPANLYEPFRERFGVLLLDGYGSTETNHVIGVPGDGARPGYLGRVVDEFDAQVVDEQDAPVPDGTPGELVVRSRRPFSIASGYFAMPEKTVEAWRNLWFHTGDRVVREADGWFRFIDRAKDAIRRRGENISSFEVERVLLEHPSVRAAAVFPVPSELAEDEVMAAVVPEAGTGVDPLDLVRHCEQRLAYFAVPRYIDLVRELPLTENGKVRKVALRERGVTSGTWDREKTGYRLSR
jgi:carnitine-CoA ligase